MVDRTIEATWRTSRPGLILQAGGLALIGWGVATKEMAPVIGAALPATVGLMMILGASGRSFAARFTAEGIDRLAPGAGDHVLESIPYASLTGVRVGTSARNPATFRGRRGPILVQHAAGSFWIPGRVDAPVAEIYRFLAGFVPHDGGRDVNPQLLPYLRREEERHGPESIRTFGAVPPPPRAPRPRARAICGGLVLGGVVWSALGFAVPGQEDWKPIGILPVAAGLIGYLLTLATAVGPRRYVRPWKTAGIVLGPDGLAMVQGPVGGEIRWPEVRKIDFVDKPKGFHLTGTANLVGVRLHVPGAMVVIMDIYDRPTYVIHAEILRLAPAHLRPVELVEL